MSGWGRLDFDSGGGRVDTPAELRKRAVWARKQGRDERRAAALGRLRWERHSDGYCDRGCCRG